MPFFSEANHLERNETEVQRNIAITLIRRRWGMVQLATSCWHHIQWEVARVLVEAMDGVGWWLMALLMLLRQTNRKRPVSTG